MNDQTDQPCRVRPVKVLAVGGRRWFNPNRQLI